MAGNDKLSAFLGQLMDQDQKGQLPLRGEGSLRLVQNIEAFFGKGSLHQGHKTFAVGLIVEGLPAKTSVVDLRGHKLPVLFRFRCNIVKALRPKEIAALWAPGAFHQKQGLMEAGMGLIGGKIIIAGSALRIKAKGDGDSFQEGGFSCAVLTGKQGDIPVKDQRAEILKGWDGPDITVSIQPVPAETDFLKIPHIHRDSSWVE